LGTGGLIQAALSAGAQVRVAYLTNGEFNEISSISYQIKPLLIKSDFLKNGRTRKAEAITAMSFFGLRREDLFFFGYPDSGTIKIWQRYWNGVKPFRGFFTRINKVLDPDDVSYGSYYRGESVVRDFEKVLLAFRPTHIFVTAPFDINFDHQASYLYLNVALLDLKDRLDPFPSTHLYIIHARNWPRPKSLAPGQPLTPPDAVKGLKTLPWKTFPLSEDQINRKREVVLRYKTQIAYSKNFLLAFVRSNELYLDMAYEPVAAREENPRAEAAEEKIASERDVKYKIIGKDIFIDIPLQTRMEEMGVLTTDLFGYRKGLPFEQMPKLSLRFFGNRLFIKDGSRSVSDQRVRYKIEEKRVLVQIPFQVLRSPDYLFVSTRTAKDVILPGFGAWRILELPKKLRV
jgi:LmbE family N-acetylglucosaminyl deacetylase